MFTVSSTWLVAKWKHKSIWTTVSQETTCFLPLKSRFSQGTPSLTEFKVHINTTNWNSHLITCLNSNECRNNWNVKFESKVKYLSALVTHTAETISWNSIAASRLVKLSFLLSAQLDSAVAFLYSETCNRTQLSSLLDSRKPKSLDI